MANLNQQSKIEDVKFKEGSEVLNVLAFGSDGHLLAGKEAAKKVILVFFCCV